MAFKKFIIKDSFKKSNSSFITITPHTIIFSVGFVTLARLTNKAAVEVHIDEENGMIGFEFVDVKTDTDNCYTLIFRKNRDVGDVKFSNRAIVKKHKWIDKVSKLEGDNRRFTPPKIKGLWAIKLCPAFEIKKERKSNDIPSDHVGIYRYLRNASNEIVYIGKGVIKDRAQSTERKEWDFDIIEYSIVKNLEDQIKWEHYWLEKFKTKHDNNLPFYNEISGSAKYQEK